MKLLSLPPLMLLCSELLLQHPVILAAPTPTPTSTLEQPSAQAVYTRRRRPANVIFHPASRSCVLRSSLRDPLKLGPCDQSDNWEYTPQKFLVVKGTYFCLQAAQPGKPAQLGIICSEPDSSWDVTSNVKTQISAAHAEEGGGGGGPSLCLDVDASSNTLMTNPCLCLSSGVCEPGSQWFQFTDRSQVGGSEITYVDEYTSQNSP